VLEGNETQRFDSEYFQKEFIKGLEKIANNKYFILEKIAFVKGGKRLPKGEKFQEKGVPYIRAEDIRNNFVDYENSPKISYKLHERLKQYQTKFNDVLLTIVGNIGDIGIVKFKINKCNLTENAAKIVELKKIKPEVLFIFLLSKYGQLQIEREKVGTVQPKLALERIRKFKIPFFEEKFQQKIEDLVNEAYEKLKISKKLYKQAEDLLLEELGLKDFKPSEENIAIKSLKDSFLNTGRLDAEYYQPKYEEVEKKIKQNGYKLIKDICNNINYGTVPTSPYVEEGIPYIKGLNLKDLSIDTTKLDFITNADNLPNKFFTKKDDIIISQMGTVGNVGVITEKEENWLFASFTIRIRLKDTKQFRPLIVALYIQNIAKEWYLKRNIAQASVRQNTDLPTIKNMYIPIIDIDIQLQIENLIKTSFKLKEESKNLLDLAVKMVEEEIENGE